MGIMFSELSGGKGSAVLLGDEGSVTKVNKEGFVSIKKKR
jgi:hypothetical protein